MLETIYDAQKFGNIKISDATVELFKHDFKKLNPVEAKQVLDIKMELLQMDMITEDQLCVLFDELDVCDKYEDMMFLFAAYSRVLVGYYELKSSCYNINNKWDGVFKKNIICGASKDDILYDLLDDFFSADGFAESEVALLLTNKIYKNKDLKTEFKILRKKNLN
ncbi:MAG: hypothetical protein Satyrvirus29_3 [Satyrvirus sp.]|uniref:Uncharacterized protein n=1 Tax=Satyrvirus sp. TaxID=2487771 RepID=A0A3G5AEQ1_9VIRU|nr:MAG: hypothetical protein Satyrvirus29_3 [Satyrvirus sp.]